MADMPSMNPQDQQAAQKVVLGCMKLLFDKATFKFLRAGLQSTLPMPQKLASQAVGVMKLFAGRVQGQIPRQVLIPSAVMLVLEIAKFMAKAGFGKPTGADVKAASQMVAALVKKAFPEDGAPPAAPAAPAPAQPGLIGAQ